MLPLWARVDPGVMAMKEYSTFPKAPALLEPHHQVIVISRTLIGSEGLSPLQRSNWCILQPTAIQASGEKAKWELHKNAAYRFEQILKAVLYKTAAVWLLTSHLTNYPSKMSKTVSTAGEVKTKLKEMFSNGPNIWTH